MGSRRSLHRVPVAGAAAATILAACGSTSGGNLSPERAGALRTELAAIQTAAAGGNRGAALTALDAFTSDVHRDGGELSAVQRSALGTGAARLRARILDAVAAPVAAPSAATTTSATATTVTTTAAPTTTSSSTAPGPPKPAQPAQAPKTPPGQAGRAGPHPGHGHGPGGTGPPGQQGPGNGNGNGQ